jgi:hypothetical protein
MSDVFDGATADTVESSISPDADGSISPADSAGEPETNGEEDAIGETGDADGEASLIPMSWVVGANPRCITASFAECTDDTDLIAFTVFEAAMDQATCSMARSTASLWFPEGTSLSAGDYTIMAANSQPQTHNVPTGMVVLQIQGFNGGSTWWAQSGTVHVAVDNDIESVTFDSLPATDGVNTVPISGYVVFMISSCATL